MTVHELIKELYKIPNQEKEVRIITVNAWKEHKLNHCIEADGQLIKIESEKYCINKEVAE